MINEFNNICYDWDIHRIAFGPCTITTNRQHGQQSVASSLISFSWIIISKDGKVAWKNIPIRLHNNLFNRMASDSTPCEVSLGANQSYFIKFVDGTLFFVLCAFVPLCVKFSTHFSMHTYAHQKHYINLLVVKTIYTIGTSDWQLPAKTAQVCQDLENNGKTIMSISLHTELSNDFIIRHRWYISDSGYYYCYFMVGNAPNRYIFVLSVRVNRLLQIVTGHDITQNCTPSKCFNINYSWCTRLRIYIVSRRLQYFGSSNHNISNEFTEHGFTIFMSYWSTGYFEYTV